MSDSEVKLQKSEVLMQQYYFLGLVWWQRQLGTGHFQNLVTVDRILEREIVAVDIVVDDGVLGIRTGNSRRSTGQSRGCTFCNKHASRMPSSCQGPLKR